MSLASWCPFVPRRTRGSAAAARAPDAPYFKRGDGQGVENVLAGAWQEIDITAFDFWYYDESTDSKGNTSRRYSRYDCAITTIDAACSHLTIDHENLLTRIAGPKIQPVEFLPLLGTLKLFRDQVPRAVFSLYPKSG